MATRPWVFLVGAALLIGCGDDKQVANPQQVREQVDTTTAPEQELVAVPNLGDKDEAHAIKRVEGRDLELKVKRQHHETEQGLVFRQSPAAGRQVRPGTVVTVTISKGPKEPPPPAGPSGALGTNGVGSAQIGMSAEQVEARFGAPPAKEEVNFGGGPAPQIDWVWSFPDGDLRLQFDTSSGTLTGYVCDTANFATVSGFKVGSPFSGLRERYGDQLTESPIGGPAENGDGLWVLSDGEAGTYPALTFGVEDDVIASISGGEPQSAGE
jgi:hypothetical protein